MCINFLVLPVAEKITTDLNITRSSDNGHRYQLLHNHWCKPLLHEVNVAQCPIYKLHTLIQEGKIFRNERHYVQNCYVHQTDSCI